MKFYQIISLCIISGILLGLSWFFGLTILIFVAFVPLFFVEDYFAGELSLIKKSKLKLFGLTYITFLIWNILTTWWVYNASLGGALMAILTNSLLMATIFIFYHRIKTKISFLNTTYTLIPIWLAWEYGHTLWDISWTWLTLGNVFAFKHNWIQWYEYTGVSGGSFWILIVNVLIFETIRYKKANKILSKQILKIASSIIVPILMSYLILNLRLSNTTKNLKQECVIVQPNLDPYNEKFYFDFKTQFLRMLKQVDGKITENSSYLILPETYMINDMNEDMMDTYEEIAWFKDSILKKFPNLNIVTGASTYKFYKANETPKATARYDEQSKLFYEYYNTAVLINNKGITYYHKSKLVPGVEKMPFPIIFKPLEKLAINLGGTIGSLGTQEERTILKCNNNVNIAPVICYESVYGDYTSGYMRNGANLIAIITNDGWWGNTPGYKQHLNYARLRAIETRKQIVRSANTGISCLIDEFGNIHNQTEYEKLDVITVYVNPNSTLTFFSKFGDMLSYASSFLAVVFLIISSTRKYWQKN